MIITGIVLNTFLYGFNGFLQSVLSVIISFVFLAIIPGFKKGGGDIKLAMGYGAYIGKFLIIKLFFFYLLIVLFINVRNMIKKDGISGFYKSLKLEITSFGFYKEEGEKMPGALIMFISYILTISSEVII